MNPDRMRLAVAHVAEMLRKDETVDLPDALVGEDAEGWLEDLARATIAKDARRVKQGIRGGSRRGWVQLQLSLPGLGHASLPPAVWDGDTGIPITRATVSQIRKEVGLQRRTVNIEDQVVSGWEATLERFQQLGIPDEETVAEIMDRYQSAAIEDTTDDVA